LLLLAAVAVPAAKKAPIKARKVIGDVPVSVEILEAVVAH
jgi:hypothetical protein